jgi:hypothetical protein
VGFAKGRKSPGTLSKLSVAHQIQRHARSKIRTTLESLLASAAIWISSKHTAQAMSPGSEAAAPSGATDAVLKPSEPVPADAKEVQGIDFNQYANRSITVEELIAGYSTMGFQATAVGEAVRIINDMVSRFVLPAAAFERGDSR